jgi:hypothetical protein
MPTVLRVGSYRFFFYASDHDEPPHVHVEAGERTAKFWLAPVRIQRSSGFGRVELRRVQQLVLRHRDELMKAWDEYFHA